MTTTPGRRPHLICSIGKGNYRPVTYRLGEQTETSRFGTVALARVLNLAGARATVLATDDADVLRLAGELVAELVEARLDAGIVWVPEGRSESEAHTIVSTLVATVSDDETVILDVSLGLRHLPFVYLAALTYLSALRGVPVDGIYNGPYELRDPSTNIVDFVDLRPLLDLTNWYHAVQTANESGDLRRIAHLLEDFARRNPSQRAATDAARGLAAALAAGLPIEAGIQAARLKKPLRKLRSNTATPAPLNLGLEPLAERVESWAVPAQTLAKRQIVLTEGELRRQLALARWHIDGRALPSALLLLREWVVNFALLSRGVRTGWLDREARIAAERAVWALGERGKDTEPEPRQAVLARLWEELADRRNELAHQGMRPPEISPDSAKVAELAGQCEALLNDGLLTFPGPALGTILVSALGEARGLLFSAVLLLEPRPDALVVLVSEKSRAGLEEALAKAGRLDLLDTDLVMQIADPYTGYLEHRQLITSEVRKRLAAAAEVVVNLTGGTTVMQYVLGKVGEEARRLGVPVRQIALADRRPRAEQTANPYVLGELIAIETQTAEEEG